MTLKKEAFENILGKRENACNQYLCLLPKMFSILSETNFNFLVTFIMLSAKTFNLDQLKILSFGKGLSVF